MRHSVAIGKKWSTLKLNDSNRPNSDTHLFPVQNNTNVLAHVGYRTFSAVQDGFVVHVIR